MTEHVSLMRVEDETRDFDSVTRVTGDYCDSLQGFAAT